MPPRFVFWTIILDGRPTAFRARRRESLVPTLTQLRARNPDAELKWFSGGRLWESPEEARHAARIAREPTRQRPTEPRGRDWRPGGDHLDRRLEWKRKHEARRAGQRAERGPGGPRRARVARPPTVRGTTPGSPVAPRSPEVPSSPATPTPPASPPKRRLRLPPSQEPGRKPR